MQCEDGIKNGQRLGIVKNHERLEKLAHYMVTTGATHPDKAISAKDLAAYIGGTLPNAYKFLRESMGFAATYDTVGTLRYYYEWELLAPLVRTQNADSYPRNLSGIAYKFAAPTVERIVFGQGDGPTISITLSSAELPTLDEYMKTMASAYNRDSYFNETALRSISNYFLTLLIK